MAQMARRRVAEYDGGGEVFLAWYEGDRYVEEIPWPDDWPELLPDGWLEAHGFEILDI